jgi:hypothetical protein
LKKMNIKRMDFARQLGLGVSDGRALLPLLKKAEKAEVVDMA